MRNAPASLGLPRTKAPPLRAVPPSPTDERYWRLLLNRLYLAEEGRLFEWLRDSVRPAEPGGAEQEPGKSCASGWQSSDGEARERDPEPAFDMSSLIRDLWCANYRGRL